jgi:hypothetical protein
MNCQRTECAEVARFGFSWETSDGRRAWVRLCLDHVESERPLHASVVVMRMAEPFVW